MSVVSKNQYWENRVSKNKKDKYIKIQYAKVTGLTPQGAPIIRFNGDSKPSDKIYLRLKTYVPVIGERVILINEIIQGAVTT